MHYPIPSRFIKKISPDILRRDQPADITIQSSEETGIHIGASVRHPSFGEGVVLELEGSGDATRVSVQFRHAGIKRLMLKYAALEAV
jgi:DNA helicase-2/ATP-dependent DNA helicase PcrA